MTAISALIDQFTTDLAAAARREALADVMLSLSRSKLPAAKHPSVIAGARKAKARRKHTVQLCPVPRCANRAAPVFGMVCAKHKDVPKATIKKYREARRAAKRGGR